MYAKRLQTEYLTDPLGVDFDAPRLMWNCADGIRQTAYRVVCRAEDALLWDSGRVESGSMYADYAGEPLDSRVRVEWRVMLWDENGKAGEWSETAFSERGLSSADWSARWIAGDYKVNKKRRYPVDCFRRCFTLGGEVKRARLYATACGLYAAYIGGERVDGFVLAPGHTDYRVRVQYQTYDVTAMLKRGENTLEFMLADGWYRGSCGAWGLKNQYGTETRLLAQLEVDLADGSRVTVATDGDWDWSGDGPIRFADNKDGEVVEAWRTPSYSGRARLSSHSVAPTASNNVPVTEHERFKPTLIETPSGKRVLDFGQNIAGYVEFSVDAHRGQRIFLRFGEMLDRDGEFTQANIQCSNKRITTPLQQVEYLCADGENRYKTTFAIFGFRYVLVETDAEFSADDFTAVAVYSDLEQTGFFDSSNALLDRFVDATLWSAKGNFVDVPTDCPTRERHGWSGDAQIFSETAAYLFNFAPFAQKYLADMYDWQRADGCLPQIAPYGGVDSYMNTMNGSVGWSDAGVIIPYQLSRVFGDRRILERYYDGMKRYAEFMLRRCGKRGLLAKRIKLGEAQRYLVNAGQSYGEWLEPADVSPNHWTDVVAPHPEVSTAYTAYVMRLMSMIAAELGRAEDAEYFARQSDGCTRAYRALCKLPEFTLDTDRQARLVRPLAFDLLDDEQTAFAKHRLLEALEHYGYRLGTGFLSTPLILDVLAEIDVEAAYRLLENEQMPGWLFMSKMGATTVWESWEGTEAKGGIASLNHYSKGAVCAWLFRTMCGIRVAGENRFVIAPRPGGGFTHASARYVSVCGEVASAWRRTDDGYSFTVTVPPNTTAEVVLPNGETHTAEAGTHTFLTA